MGRRQQLPVSVDVDESGALFEAWRRTHKGGERIPDELWSEASGLAQRSRTNLVSLALGLSRASPKEHLERG